jgi:hypothetical protein
MRLLLRVLLVLVLTTLFATYQCKVVTINVKMPESGREADEAVAGKETSATRELSSFLIFIYFFFFFIFKEQIQF